MRIGKFTIKRDDPEHGQHVYGVVYLPEHPSYTENTVYVGIYKYAIGITWERAS